MSNQDQHNARRKAQQDIVQVDAEDASHIINYIKSQAALEQSNAVEALETYPFSCCVHINDEAVVELRAISEDELVYVCVTSVKVQDAQYDMLSLVSMPLERAAHSLQLKIKYEALISQLYMDGQIDFNIPDDAGCAPTEAAVIH